MIGIFGGTFDPVHNGHLRMALEVYQALGLDELRFVPCCRPPHRGPAVIPAQARLEMLQMAIQGQAGFVIDRREYDREGPSYTVDTLCSLRQSLGMGRPLCLMMGMDAFISLPGWRQWTRILELAHIVVFHRDDIPLPDRGEMAELMRLHRVWDAGELKCCPAGRIWVQDVTSLSISATALREAMAQGRSVRYLLPDVVYDYIQCHDFHQQVPIYNA